MKLVAILTMLTLSLLLTAGVFAQPKKDQPTKTWNGSVKDETLANGAPDSIANQKALDIIWKSWDQPGKAPQVDFTKELLLLTTSRGSGVSLVLQRKDKDLRVSGFGVQNIAPGFRFAMGTFPREGIETINGKPLPKTD